MKKYNEYNIEQELMEAFVLEKTDAEICMPDIDAELRRVHSLAESKIHAKSKSRLRIASIAACVAVLLGVGFATYQNQTTSKELCIAYVGGNRITDETKVMQLMAEDMSHLNGESDIVEDQLSVMFNE
ncbi:MAG: hypothetical protein MJZ29_02315 [Bacteroidaceae bacterium]|nr:hypothetical protein [Bacteroidaceae bacterium]